VVQAIENYLTVKGLPTKIDNRDFFAGNELMEEILRVMQTCDVILVFYSAKSKDRPWTEFERKAAAELQTEARKAGKQPPRVMYVVMDDTPLPTPAQTNQIALMAKGKTVKEVAEELYLQILQISRGTVPIDPEVWNQVIGQSTSVE
jgi:DNA-binding NarL/FixJ family response regulator